MRDLRFNNENDFNNAVTYCATHGYTYGISYEYGNYILTTFNDTCYNTLLDFYLSVRQEYIYTFANQSEVCDAINICDTYGYMYYISTHDSVLQLTVYNMDCKTLIEASFTPTEEIVQNEAMEQNSVSEDYHW